MKLGVGPLPDDALLFANLEGEPLQPSNVSSDWGDVAGRLGMPEVTFHGLRHTHASQLIANDVDIVTVSKRLGHAKLERYPCHLRPHVSYGRQQGCRGHQRGLVELLGWQSGGSVRICSTRNQP